MNERIKVVLLEPDKEAQIAEIETTLESMQHLVGDGFIEAFYPFAEEVCIVCNDREKSTACRSIVPSIPKAAK